MNMIQLMKKCIFPEEMEIHDPDPIDIMKYGRICFEAYCTKVKYRNVKVRRVTYIDTAKPYDPEF